MYIISFGSTMENELLSDRNHIKLAMMGHSLSVVVIVNQGLKKMKGHLLFEFRVVVDYMHINYY